MAMAAGSNMEVENGYGFSLVPFLKLTLKTFTLCKFSSIHYGSFCIGILETERFQYISCYLHRPKFHVYTNLLFEKNCNFHFHLPRKCKTSIRWCDKTNKFLRIGIIVLWVCRKHYLFYWI